ncbi:MAG: site-specific DNA-methyltransferase [Pseudomonadota bacterium]|nr:site-specific DNA-methyltransferase [Pseudomonadota bacterium]
MKDINNKKEKNYYHLDKQSFFYQNKTLEDTWVNKIIQGDNIDVLHALLTSPLIDQIKKNGGIKLIYIDPPFEVGTNHKMKIDIGNAKNHSIGFVAYTDNRGKEKFIEFMRERLVLMRELLSSDGSLYLHCDWRTSGWFRLLLDEIFGENHLINENIWSYKTGGISKRSFAKKHDTIFLYSKSTKYIFNQQLYKSWQKKKYNYSKKYPEYFDEKEGRWYHLAVCRDVWDDIYPIGTENKERLGYPSQKPESLLERIIKTSTNEGDIVADFFSGSGTTASVAERLCRKWIISDIGSKAINVSKNRILNILDDTFKEKINSFEVLNLTKNQSLGQNSFDFNVKTNIQDGKVSFELNDLVPNFDKLPIHEKEEINLNWSDWVDSWAIDCDLNLSSKSFVANWYSVRKKDDKSIDLKTNYFKYTLGKSKFGVVVTDILGNTVLKEIFL